MLAYQRKNGISADALKWIALITMLVDHVGAVIVEQSAGYGALRGSVMLDYILRFIGRVAFPIYCFLLIEGFHKTHERKKYARNLFCFALLSEVPFQLALYNRIFLGMRNVYWTLFLGILLMLFLETIRGEAIQKYRLTAAAAVLGFAAIAEILHTDYGAVGILLIFLLYQTYEDRKTQSVLGAIAMSYEIIAPIAFLLTYFYNGRRKQRSNPYVKYFFYAFYPLHLLLLYWVRFFFF